MTVEEVSSSNEAPLHLSITVHEARGLASADEDTGSSDPYVVVRSGRREHRSRTLLRTLEPQWKDTFRMAVDEHDKRLHFRIMDQDFDSPDDPLGQLVLDLEGLSVGDEAKDEWIALEEGSGEIRVSYQLLKEFPTTDSPSPSTAGPNATASRPWAGAIFSPSGYSEEEEREGKGKEVALPQVTLGRVYGYNARGTRDNVHLLPGGSHFAYHAGGIGVVQEVSASGAQTFFHAHGSSEITAMTLNSTGNLLATGDSVTQANGEDPTVHLYVWKSFGDEHQLVGEVNGGKALKSAVSLAFSPPTEEDVEGKYLAVIGDDLDHTLAIYDWKSGKVIASTSAHSDRVLYVLFHPTDPTSLVTVGVRHIKFWTLDMDEGSLEPKKGVFGTVGKQQTLLSVAYLPDASSLITGGMNGDIYQWDLKSHQVKAAIPSGHKQKAITGLKFVGEDGTFISVSKDGRVEKHLGPLEESKSQLLHQAKENVAARAVTVNEEKGLVLVGMDNGTILSLSLDETYKKEEEACATGTALVRGHFTAGNAEIWGLATDPSGELAISASQDCQVLQWNLTQGHCTQETILPHRVQGASYHPNGETLAVTTDINHVYILSSKDLSILHEIKTPHRGSASKSRDIVSFSPDGYLLAIGGLTHEFGIDLHSTENWESQGTLLGHTSLIKALDWSRDSKYIQSNSIDYELLFWNVEEKEQITHASDLRDVAWSTFTLPTAWPTLGIWEEGMNGRQINGVARSADEKWLASGDDNARVSLFKYPAPQEGAAKVSLQGHGSHVTDVAFTADSSKILSIGGLDGTVLQWDIKA
ncbi:MAG: quinon protein alcohol dehydrogenase-like superfamily [Piptocephalis tieghemiana]|nr:MAG: quinon protein alcohol dehydrogenase-like superfamily [Piptocephalis tieghemiana]